uniref:Anillin, actin binding protein 2 n=1 Tax=Amphiprion percula TaxID=161767 RepID=A0A3P8SC19_AMPPE
MEAGEENGGNAGIKRQREPLSDTEENVFSATEANDGQKRRRLEASGQENRSPKPSSSGRLAELETKPDTPMVPSVRSRVQQLTQRRDGNCTPLAQRCFSDPGSDGPSVSIHSKGEGEFSQRMERFKAPVPQVSPAPSLSPANTCPRTRSDFVSGIQQKLQGTMTPSSKQASRIRQEREQELSQLQFQPISENVWLKRSSSDSSLTQVGWRSGESKPSSSEAPVELHGSNKGKEPEAHRDDDKKEEDEKEERLVSQQPETQTVLTLSFSDDQSFSKAAFCEDQTLSELPTVDERSFLQSTFQDESNMKEAKATERGIYEGFTFDEDEKMDSLSYGEEEIDPSTDEELKMWRYPRDKMDTESEKEKSEEEGEAKEGDEGKKTENNGDELLSFPTSGILSPLSKSVEAVVTPLESNPPSLLLTPEETSTPPAESAPLYSIDAYRTQRRSKMPTIQSVTPGVQRRAQETSNPQPSVNTKEKIAAHNEEAAKLQTVINQTLQALSCCTDEEHGRGSLEEAEAEKLLLVSCEKRSALLAEVTRLREERSSESGEAAAEDKDYVTQQPCRGTVSITNIQLPLKVEFVCSSHSRAGRPSHYFLVLIRYGPCNIVATPLATAADAQNGDTISFPTSVTLKDIRASFEIDVEVYSLVTLQTLTVLCLSFFFLCLFCPAAAHPLNTRRSSNFCLVGSHKITLASLGHSKFPLDKMKLEGKIRKLLGDEFQEKVPFLSPLEGNIYLKLDSSSHSNVQHQGFLTMFELISGYGVWHRRYFVLEGSNIFYWNHPNDKESKEAEGSISLSGSPSRCIRPVKRDACARPFTFELVSSFGYSLCWFSADTKQERLDWMEKLNQTLLDFHTWNRTQTGSQQLNSSSSLRESIL